MISAIRRDQRSPVMATIARGLPGEFDFLGDQRQFGPASDLGTAAVRR
jgi:hypothetical protein